MTITRKSRTTILLVSAVVVVGGAVAYRFLGWQPMAFRVPHIALPQQVGAGLPLAGDTSTITVLKGNEDAAEATQLTDSAHPLATTTSVTIVDDAAQPATAQTSATVPPPVFNATAAQLGTTLALLVNAWPQGGQLPHQLAAAAAQLADATGQPQLASAAASLRSATPREGPLTLQVLLLEASNAAALTPPANLPQDAKQAQEQKSWFRKQIEQLISISTTPATQNSWSQAVLTAQQQLARGAVADAMQTLKSSPLADDKRLTTLRSLVHDYLAQSGKLTNLVTAYTNTYLLPQQGTAQ